MQGIFGAGVISALEEEDVYENIGAVYGASAGALVGAYFLARQSELGSRMMFEDLTTGQFISPKNFILGILDRLSHYYIRASEKATWRNAIDIPYLFSCVEQKRRLDVDAVNEGGIPFYVKVLNASKRVLEYHDARGENLVKWLRAAVDVNPYTTETQMIEGEEYADGAIKSVVGIDTLRGRHPEAPIIVVLNTHKKRRLSHILKNKVEAFFVSRTGDADIAPLYRSAEYVLREELSRMEAMEDVYLFATPDDVPIRSDTTNVELLEKTHRAGYEAGKRIARLLQTI